MSLDLNVYCKNLSADLVPKIISRLNDFDMVVEVHPDFKLDQENDTGFIPFKFRLKNPYFEKLKNKDFKSGFEIFIDIYNAIDWIIFITTFSNLQFRNIKQSSKRENPSSCINCCRLFFFRKFSWISVYGWHFS